MLVSLVAVGGGSTIGSASAGPRLNQISHLSSHTAQATPDGNSPSDVLTYYDFPGYPTALNDAKGTPVSGTGEVIAIITNLYNPHITADIEAFDTEYGLAPLNGLGKTPCTLGGNYGTVGCFKVVYAEGTRPSKKVDEGSEIEDASDVEWAHAAAPGADIAFIEGPTNNTAGDMDGLKAAIALPADVVSMSFTDPDLATAGVDSLFDTAPSTGFVAAVGEHQAKVKGSPYCPTTYYPAGSPYVLAVGGTTVQSGGAEVTWKDTLGGVENGSHDSVAVDRPSYQLNWNKAAYRDLPDVALNAEDYSVYASLPTPGFIELDGTSIATPVWAGLIAEVDQMRVADGKSVLAGEGLLDGIYLAAGSNESKSDTINPAYFKDITYGGTVKGECSAKTGFDTVTGLGTPNASDLIDYLGYDL
jgi:subtilase family serine protease